LEKAVKQRAGSEQWIKGRKYLGIKESIKKWKNEQD